MMMGRNSIREVNSNSAIYSKYREFSESAQNFRKQRAESSFIEENLHVLKNNIKNLTRKDEKARKTAEIASKRAEELYQVRIDAQKHVISLEKVSVLIPEW